jgi:hypothetical protein
MTKTVVFAVYFYAFRLMPMCCGQLVSDSLTDIEAANPKQWAGLDLGFWQKAQEELSSQGLRVLALCRCD